MTGMLAALLGVLVVGLSLGWHKDSASDVVSTIQPVRKPMDWNAGVVNLGQPVGTEIQDVAQVGGLFALTLSGGGRGARILILDPATGETVGTINVETSNGRGPED